MTNKKLLFLTNFSEACFQAVPGIAEWMDREQGHLSIVHVTRRQGREAAPAQERLNSFFAEADRYDRCERVLLTGQPVEAIVDFCRSERPDIVFAPASKPSGLPRFFHQSLRASLLRQGGVKLWTRGRGDGSCASPRKPRNVAYAVTGHTGWVNEAMEAARFAAGYGAQLHLLYLAPWPEVHDGTVAADIGLNHPLVSVEELETVATRLPMRPELHMAIGDGPADIVRLLRACRADVAFVAERHAIRRRFFRDSMDPELDRLDCEVICYPKHPLTGHLERLTPRTRLLPASGVTAG